MLSNVKTLILGGGGIKSVAYLGAFEAMIDRGLDWHAFTDQLQVVAGSSAGSFSAALIGMGLSIDTLNQLLVAFDAKVLFAPNVVDTMIQGLSTVFSYTDYGIIHYERLQSLYESVFRQANVDPKMTLLEYKEWTGKRLDVYVTNLSTKTLECWNAITQPHIPVTFALTVSSAIPFVVTAPVIAGHLYGDGGIMSNVPITGSYAPHESLAMMLDLEPAGHLMQAVPSWFGHHLSRILDAIYEGHRMPHAMYDPLWEWNIMRLHTESITLMDTFSSEKLPVDKLKMAKSDGARSAMVWWTGRLVVMNWVCRGLELVEKKSSQSRTSMSNGLVGDELTQTES